MTLSPSHPVPVDPLDSPRRNSFRHRVGSSPVIVSCLLLSLVLLLTGVRIRQWQNDPKVYLLAGENKAKWIRAQSRFELSTHSYFKPMGTLFRCDFELTKPVANATLTIQAFRQCQVWLDTEPDSSEPVFSSPQKMSLWKKRHEIKLPGPLSAGPHRIAVAVSNQAAHPCLYLSSPDLGVYSGTRWEALDSDGNWLPAVRANDSVSNVPEQVQQAGYPKVSTSFRRVGPWLAVVFGLSFAWTWWNFPFAAPAPGAVRWNLPPGRLRWLFLAAWLLLSVNNLWRVPADMGFDVRDHLAYVKFIVEHQSLPFANDGWQMFQSPLLYLLAAPFYALLSTVASPDTCEKALRLMPLLCGLAQIEIVYRAARIVFPDQDDYQVVAMTVGGLLPMNIYMSQSFGNEPLAGCLTSLLLLLCFSLLAAPTQHRSARFFLILGAVWGLALLAKVTPLLLAPLIPIVILFHSRTPDVSLPQRLSWVRSTCGACFVIAGWYYLRNWFYLGSPFVGGWDPARGAEYKWWQDPGYRTWSQLTSFGTSLERPFYSGVLSLWDALYSSMWTDGSLSGTLTPVDRVPWNVDWMGASVWLAILPTGCMLAGVARLWNQDLRAARSSLLLATAAIGIYLAAIVDLYVHVPVYSAAKASYALGLLPCFAILAAAGAGPLLQVRLLRAMFFAALTCWAFAAYIAFFCIA